MLDPEDVHRAALPSGGASGAPVELRHHRPRLEPLGERLGVVTVGGQNVVVLPQGTDQPESHGLLADVEVTEAPDLPDRIGLLRLLLEAPVEEHVVQKGVKLLPGEAVNVPAAAALRIPGALLSRLRIRHIPQPFPFRSDRPIVSWTSCWGPTSSAGAGMSASRTSRISPAPPASTSRACSFAW